MSVGTVMLWLRRMWRVSVPYVRDVRWDAGEALAIGITVSVPYVRDVRWDIT